MDTEDAAEANTVANVEEDEADHEEVVVGMMRKNVPCKPYISVACFPALRAFLVVRFGIIFLESLIGL